MPLINCEINLMLACSANCIINNSTGAETFATTDAKLFVLVVTLTTPDNIKLLEQLNQDSNKQLIGINVNQKYQYQLEIIISITWLIQDPTKLTYFLFYN